MIRRVLAAIVRWAADRELLTELREQETAAWASVDHLARTTTARHDHRELHPLETGWYADGDERRFWWEDR